MGSSAEEIWKLGWAARGFLPVRAGNVPADGHLELKKKPARVGSWLEFRIWDQR